MTEIKLLNGAFTATLVKSENGKQSWQYSPNTENKIVKSQDNGSMKEKPQYDIINQIEGAAVDNFKQTVGKTTITITKYLKSLL